MSEEDFSFTGSFVPMPGSEYIKNLKKNIRLNKFSMYLNGVETVACSVLSQYTEILQPPWDQRLFNFSISLLCCTGVAFLYSAWEMRNDKRELSELENKINRKDI